MNQPMVDAFFEKAPVAFAVFRTVFYDSGHAVDAELLTANLPFQVLFRKKADEMIGHCVRELVSSAALSQDEWGRRALSAIEGRRLFDEVVSGLFPEKSLRVKLFPLFDDQFGCILRDLGTEALLRDEVEGFLAVSLDMFMIGSQDGRFLKVNRQFETVIGYTVKEMEGHYFSDFLHPDDVELTKIALGSLIKDGGIQKLVNRLVAKNGQIKTLEWRALPTESVFYASARDISDQVNKEAQLRKEAEIDPLTGLFNRHYLYQRIQQEISLSEKRGTPVSMIAVDIDHFKYVNDIWGHPVGDEVLERTASLMKTAIRGTDFLARIGGEEFVALLPGTDAEGALTVARKMHRSLNDHPHPRVGKVTASFGVALRETGEDFLQWYKRADEAVYSAKRGGRNRVVLAGETTPETQSVSIYMAWNPEWDSKDPTIDAQHRELIDIGNHLVFLAVSGGVAHQISRQIDRLLVHVANHFATEESILSETAYPELPTHQMIHKDLLRRTGELAADYLRQPTPSPIFLSFMINDLIIGHLVDEDRKFFPFLPRSVQ